MTNFTCTIVLARKALPNVTENLESKTRKLTGEKLSVFLRKNKRRNYHKYINTNN